ncbi:hypothetical protein IKF34_00425 [Candidatus Saccharibacteria bacterium]|nr:hypothetical protein [Candidatus Saccharibacteria bacterium]
MVSRARETKKMKKTLISGVAVTMVAAAAMVNLAHGLTYSQDIGVSFTFHPVIGLTLSSDLIIPNLAPGTATDSNIIDVNVITNSTNGYTLNASVGNSTTYNTRNLVHTNNTVPNTFSSVDFGSSITSNTSLSDNTWAYSYSINDGTNWTNYSGLPLYSDTTNVAQLKNSSTPVSSASGDNIKFKIAAKASNTQASGEYRNVINFELVATPLPTTLSMAYENAGKEKHNGYFKLQDMNANICNAAEVVDEGSQMQAIDTRDNKVYWITKLRDGKCWFTQNLDHDINKDRTYTPQDTDVPANWTPDKSTYATGDTTWDTLRGELPPGGGGLIWHHFYGQQSYDPGNKIWDGMPRSNGQTLDSMIQGSGPHYHLGNYYNFGAAVAMNDTSTFGTAGQNVDQSICPAGWTLPAGDENAGAGSIIYMLEEYGYVDDAGAKMTEPYVWESPLYFTLGGYWSGSSSAVSHYSALLLSTVLDNRQSSINLFAEYDGTVGLLYSQSYMGYSVRCVSR